jgi:hypothetical protein
MGTPQSSREHRTMKRFLVVAAFAGITFLPSFAKAQERLGDGAMGALAGALVGGPIGLVAGGVVGLYGRAGNCVKLGLQGAQALSPRALPGAIGPDR